METKTCAVCGRRMQWRKKWANTWDSVKYCSERCRRSRSQLHIGVALESGILNLLSHRGRHKTICPSEVARQVAVSRRMTDWRELMEPTRAAARRLAEKQKLVITQKGRVVDPSHAKGAIRLRLL